MKTEWMHVNIWFKKSKAWEKDNYMSQKNQRNFEKLLAVFFEYATTHLELKRKFYLYEPVPHCFIALEIPRKSIQGVANYFSGFNLIPYIAKTSILENSGDAGNGEGFLNVLNAMTDFYLFHRDNKLTHVVHCALEFIFANRLKENEFYKTMAILYQEKRIKKGKPVYSHKHIGPLLRMKLGRYINSLDLKKRDGKKINE